MIAFFIFLSVLFLVPMGLIVYAVWAVIEEETRKDRTCEGYKRRFHLAKSDDEKRRILDEWGCFLGWSDSCHRHYQRSVTEDV